MDRPRDPKIDIHIRISRKVVWVVGAFILLSLLSYVLLIRGGHGSGGLEIQPLPQSRSTP